MTEPILITIQGAGPSASLLVPGKSAYELAAESGFEGTIDDWLLSLAGSDLTTPAEALETTTGTMYTWDVASKPRLRLTLAHAVTINAENAVGVGSAALVLVQDETGGQEVTFGSGFLASGGNPPAVAQAAEAATPITCYESAGSLFIRGAESLEISDVSGLGAALDAKLPSNATIPLSQVEGGQGLQQQTESNASAIADHEDRIAALEANPAGNDQISRLALAAGLGLYADTDALALDLATLTDGVDYVVQDAEPDGSETVPIVIVNRYSAPPPPPPDETPDAITDLALVVYDEPDPPTEEPGAITDLALVTY